MSGSDMGKIIIKHEDRNLITEKRYTVFRKNMFNSSIDEFVTTTNHLWWAKVEAWMTNLTVGTETWIEDNGPEDKEH